MPNLSPNKTPMREQSPDVRRSNWDEVALGYTEEEAILEAQRCLNCPTHPCMDGCPVAVKIPAFIRALAEGHPANAFHVIKDTNALPAVCGRVCPQEKQCESRCVRAKKGESVGIGRLERFTADWAAAHPEAVSSEKTAPANGHRVAVVGSGPASLTCAGDLVKRGYDVTVFEALHRAGGVLVFGIPEFRLPKTIVAGEIESLERLGVKIETDMVIGRVLSVDDLLCDGYEAVFIGTGAGLPMFLNIPGESACGVFSANEFLTRINLMKAYRDDYDTPLPVCRKVVVVGGGNVAMDAARCARRLGAEVTVVYRRSESEMPARLEEIAHAKEEGVTFRMLTDPSRILADENGFVRGVVCDEMVLGEPDASGRPRPQKKPDSSFEIEADTVIAALGNRPNPLIRMTTPGLDTTSRGCLVTAEDGVTTTQEGVFAGGDAVTGAATVILAMGAGKQAADAIDRYIRKKSDK